MATAQQLNVAVSGPVDAPVLVFLHGFGCGQQIWRRVAPAFEVDHRVVVLDLPGAGGADPAAYDARRHASLEGYAEDVLQVLGELTIDDVTVVGHSVSAMIGVLAHLAAPAVVRRLVLVAAWARYIDDAGYDGGFSEDEIDELLALMDRNHLGWQEPLSRMVAGSEEGAERAELEDSFCRTRPDIAAQFAAVTFRGDNRSDLQRVRASTLVLQVREDLIAPISAGTYVRDHVAGSTWRILETHGHAPHLSAPESVIAATREFLDATAHG